MPRFFNRIRKQLAKDNRFIQYSRYAVGEIILVVIGILIALKISDANEQRKDEQKVYITLGQVEKELETNIEKCDRLLKAYMQVDSLVYLVLNQKVDASDYKGESGDLFRYLIAGFGRITIETNAFENLVVLADDIPKTLDSTFSDLKGLYNGDLEIVKSDLNFHTSDVVMYQNWLKLNTSWYHHVYYDTYKPINEDELDFYLTSDYYQNQVANFWFVGVGNYFTSVGRFRYHAYKCYKSIAKQLQLEEELVKNPPSFYYDPEAFNFAMGTYRDSTLTYTIFNQNNELFVQRDKQTPVTLIPLNKSQFIGVPGRWILNLTFDEQGKVTGLNNNFGANRIELKKIE